MWWIVVVLAVVVAVITGAALARRRGAAGGSAARATPNARPAAPPPPPMTDLESALAQVTDRDGRPIRERIEAEAVNLDPLRDPNDTGPLLRRALDSIVSHEPDADDGPTRPT